MLVEVAAKPLVHELLDWALDVAIQLAFGLAFELRLRQLYRYHRDQPFAHVVAGDGYFVFLLLEHARGAGEIVDRARQRGAKTGEMRAAVHGVDGVGEGEDVFGIAVVVLQRDFHFEGVALALDIDGRIVQHFLAAIEVLHEFGDAAGEAELGGLVAALVLQRDFQALVQEGQLAQALRQDVVAENGLFEDAGVGVEGDFVPVLRVLPLTVSFDFGMPQL